MDLHVALDVGVLCLSRNFWRKTFRKYSRRQDAALKDLCLSFPGIPLDLLSALLTVGAA